MTGLMDAFERIESGGRPDAWTRLPSGRMSRYRGLFQFGPDMERRYGITDWTNPDQQRRAFGQHIGGLRTDLTRRLGRDPADWELYFGHQQGPSGSTALLNAAPGTAAWRAIRQYYGSDALAQQAIMGNIPRTNPLSRLSPDQVTAADFAQMWQQRFGRAMPGGGGAPLGAPTPAPRPGVGEDYGFGGDWGAVLGVPQGGGGGVTPPVPPPAPVAPPPGGLGSDVASPPPPAPGGGTSWWQGILSGLSGAMGAMSPMGSASAQTPSGPKGTRENPYSVAEMPDIQRAPPGTHLRLSTGAIWRYDGGRWVDASSPSSPPSPPPVDTPADPRGALAPTPESIGAGLGFRGAPGFDERLQPPPPAPVLPPAPPPMSSAPPTPRSSSAPPYTPIPGAEPPPHTPIPGGLSAGRGPLGLPRMTPVPGGGAVTAPPPPPPTTTGPFGEAEILRPGVTTTGGFEPPPAPLGPPPAPAPAPGGPPQPGYFERLMQNPAFLAGLSILGTAPGGNWGPAGAQAASAAFRNQRERTEFERLQTRRTTMDRVWAEAFQNGRPNMTHPLMQGLPPEMAATIFAMGPEEGLPALQRWQMFRGQQQFQQDQRRALLAPFEGGGGPPPSPGGGGMDVVSGARLRAAAGLPGAEEDTSGITAPPPSSGPPPLAPPPGSGVGLARPPVGAPSPAPTAPPQSGPTVTFGNRTMSLAEARSLALRFDTMGQRSEVLEDAIKAAERTALPSGTGERISAMLAELASIPTRYGGDEGVFSRAVGPFQGPDPSWTGNPLGMLARPMGSLSASLFASGEGSSAPPAEVRRAIDGAVTSLAATIKPLIRGGAEGTWSDTDQARLDAIVGNLASASDVASYNRELENVRRRISALMLERGIGGLTPPSGSGGGAGGGGSALPPGVTVRRVGD